ncbi:Cysteine dioxygenase [Meloidogyne graminicola]|uniref:Cysteine dioxygenase n=1 Tax=Meloidogyne graminicola TaxID=189291 RepID=A0A8S9ZM66_9BILA|nr:Cysteine dioxygenase [Meloidogyne graminicola]
MDKLIKEIREIFNEDSINIEEVKQLLEEYKSNANDWNKFALFDPHKYTRNLVDAGNGKYNLMILCWGPGMGSSIHDHTNAHCFVKVLQGNLLETRFELPIEEQSEKPLIESGTQLYKLNGVSYISDKIGLHRMENPSHSDSAITLHLYIPPFTHCNTFNQRTGFKQKCNVTFYSKFGNKVDYCTKINENSVVKNNDNFVLAK